MQISSNDPLVIKPLIRGGFLLLLQALFETDARQSELILILIGWHKFERFLVGQ